MAVNTNTVFSVFSFIGFVMSFVPLYWHLEAWNVGTCMYMIWTGSTCLMYFINSIVWAGNAVNWAPVWCDISSRMIVGIAVAIPTASLCINRRLYHIASPTTVTKTKREKRREVIVDLSICLGVPVLEMLLQYIVEGHRFDIFEDYGCAPVTVNTYPAYFLVSSWPLAIGLVSSVYCVLTLKAFMKRRKQFKELVTAHNNLQYSRFLRLMGLANIEILSTVPLSIYVIYINATSPALPWISWDFIHTTYSLPGLYPKSVYGQNSRVVASLELSRWLVVVCAFIFFGFFGFAEEAKKHYHLAISSVAKRTGRTILSSSTQSSSHVTSYGKGRFNLSLSGYNSKENEVKRDSASSFSDKLSTSIYINDFTATDELKLRSYPSNMSFAPSSPSLPLTPHEFDRPGRVQELAWDSSSSFRRPSVPDAPKTPDPDSVMDAA